ncbi:MAG: preprotein translocase subunit YajC [Paracoccaceae bacterium]
MFVTPAHAQTAGEAGAMSGLAGIIPFILMFVIFYFLLIRPQQKRMKEHKQMVENLRRGDQVVTAGGMMAKVTKVLDDDEVELQIAEGVKVRVVRSTISAVVSKTEPATES